MLTASWEPSQIVPDLPAIPYTASSICPSYCDLVKIVALFTLLPGPRWGLLGNLPGAPPPPKSRQPFDQPRPCCLLCDLGPHHSLLVTEVSSVIRGCLPEVVLPA